MSRRRKRVERHLSTAELERATDAATRAGDARLLRRLCLIGNLYAGDTLEEAGSRVGVSQPTASRWVDAWNDGGVDGLRPRSGGGRPPKVDDEDLARVGDRLGELDDPSPADLQRAVEAEFGVSYSRRHAARLLARLGRE